jgi:dienelactone hydrolase/predicted Ser/Thr protein kinase
MIGALLNNRYRIDVKLGEGGMGVVYKAHDTLLDRPVAIKALSPTIFSDQGLKRLLREAQSAAKLAHPGIVAIHDVLEDGGARHIVMEFVEGKTLRDLIPMPWREAAGLMAQVFEAMDFAHGRGIIHRDLKPENVIITPEGRARVMDFGLARSEGRSRLTQTGMVVGTALYMAPEQALQGKAEPRSDLYALGCVFYEVITGQPPFAGEDPLAIITQHINLAPRTPRHHVPDLPPALEALILKLLAKDPTERPRSAGDVARMLDLMGSRGAVAGLAEAAHEGLVGRGPTDRLRRVRLVGRADPLRRLMDRLDGLMSGTGGMVLVSGEPGIGKTRVVDEVVAAARMRGLQVLIGRCHERDVAIPYLPVADALEGFARSCPSETWERLLQAAGAEIVALLADQLTKHITAGTVIRPDNPSALAGQVDVRPARGVRNLLAAMTQTAPVLWVVDDLHWADPPSLELIHHLALYTREIPVLILGAYREVELERTHPLSGLLVDLNRERLLIRERLRRFSSEETGELLAAMLGGLLPEGLADLIHEQTEGNPFFIEELVNGLVEDGRLVWNDQEMRYRLAPGTAVERLAGEVPQGIRAAIGARLDRLGSETQQVLALASVIGRHFSLEILNRFGSAHGLTEEAVEQALGYAQAARFVAALERTAGGRDDIAGFTAGAPEIEADYAFDHPLIHQVVYGELDRRRRRRLHAEVGHLLEDLYRGREGLHTERLAYHFLESDDDAKALEYSIRAGDKMLRAFYDPDMALGYYLPALEMIVGKEASLRHLGTKSPVPIRRGAVHRFTAEERDAVVAYLGDVLSAVRETPAAKAVAQLANRICVAAMHLGEVYEASIRLYEQSVLGPDVQKLVVETERGKLVGILEFHGPGGSFPVVLMFHGSGGGKETLADQARPYLARGMATLRVDLPGWGETTVPATATLADAEVLKEMITAVLGHERVDPRGVGIIGWSLGPWHGAQLCARDGRVRAMVSISGSFNWFDRRPGNQIPEALVRARMEAQWKAGKRASPEPLKPSADTNVFDVAHQIRCPMLLVYGALEPELFRAQAEELAAVVPTARAKAWRSGVHALFNVPEAFEQAADWMKEQLLGPGGAP